MHRRISKDGFFSEPVLFVPNVEHQIAGELPTTNVHLHAYRKRIRRILERAFGTP